MPKFSITKKSFSEGKCDSLLVILAAKKGKPMLSSTAQAVDGVLNGLLSTLCKRGDFSAGAGDTLTLHAQDGMRVTLVGIGEGTIAEHTQILVATVGGMKKTTILGVVPPEDAGAADLAAVVAAVGAGAYQYKLGASKPATTSLKEVRWMPVVNSAMLVHGGAIAEGVRLARHLAEQPGNVCTPRFLAKTATQLAKDTTLKATVIDEKQMRKLKMYALLGVSQGSREAPRLITLEHRGGRGAPVVLVGKGVTFDTGGVSLKPAAAMDEMKFDMCGAASVFGALLACARMKLPLNVVGVVPSCENMPGGAAIKPGDVITAMNGKTIEVLNTDAEGRLILADALTYAERYKPAVVVDVATLTGACVIALGHHVSGMTANDDKLATELVAAGEESGDPCWRLPLGDKYSHQLKSDYADLANIGGRSAGTITAAAFLSQFTKCKHWAHLDIAGTAWTTQKRATGRPVPLLTRFLMRRAGIVK
ncbi:leucyl aminopeptidase [Candidatus Persebacteraceae bacterium Df01]|jgi:leucyl aminopeptidase|uniref:Probable cytosol aminopeptidase n=1 Tax=Candidatus Doriopsillibacter californiensis TaxID=2970740 RepID=A0ABT7QJW9_9GAMM|nr:leucyl aminopeptidase [Candidatus Persebacteraceae bacterium Df01]